MPALIYTELNPGKKYNLKVDEADRSEFLDTFQDAGIELQNDMLVVDIDNVEMEVIESIIGEWNINTHTVRTDRGVHLYFQKPNGWKRATGTTPLGIKVEYKHSKNTKLLTVKRNGDAREVTNEGVFEAIPNVLIADKKYQCLYGLVEGDGRNNAMYKHRRQIQHLDDWRKTMGFINDHILSEPFEEEEFQLIMRDISTVEDDRPEEIRVSDAIMKEKKVVMYAGLLWWLDGEGYESNPKKLDRLIASYAPNRLSKFYKEVAEQIRMRATLIPDGTTFPIRLKNGIIADGEFWETDYKEFTPYVIDVEYKADASPVKIVDEYFEHISLGDPCYKNLLIEVMSYGCITDVGRTKALARFFIAVGRGGNGKGTFLDVIRTIYGEHNTSALDIEQLPDEKHLYGVVGKLYNLGDDIIDKPIDKAKMKVLKNISTADIVQVRQLYKGSESLRITAKMVFTSNHDVRTFEKGEAMKRRITFLPIDKKVENPDPDLLRKLQAKEAREYLLRLVIEGYQRLYTTNKFTTCKLVNDYNASYHDDNNSTLEFVNDHVADDFLGKRSPVVYQEYEAWVLDNLTSKPLSPKQLLETIEVVMGLKPKPVKANGKTQRVFQPMR